MINKLMQKCLSNNNKNKELASQHTRTKQNKTKKRR